MSGGSAGKSVSGPTRQLGWLSSRFRIPKGARWALILFAAAAALSAAFAAALHVGDHGHRNGAGALPQPAAGDCLAWPEHQPDQAAVVDCATKHRFEVAASLDTAPDGSDLAAAPAAADAQINTQCRAAVQRYLGAHYDPDSRFVVSALVLAGQPARTGGHTLCGLQLPGTGGHEAVFTGKVAQLDQSKVWPAGTCLGIQSGSDQPSDTAVDCSAPHAAEVTGAVDLSAAFSGTTPSESDQDPVIEEACTRITDAYLEPNTLAAHLTLTYSPISTASWSAGSHQVACRIGAARPDGGMATMTGSAKGPVLINGHRPAPTASPASPTTPTSTATDTTARQATSTPSPIPHGVGEPDPDEPNAPEFGPAPGPAPEPSDNPAAPEPPAPAPEPPPPLPVG